MEWLGSQTPGGSDSSGEVTPVHRQGSRHRERKSTKESNSNEGSDQHDINLVHKAIRFSS
jgi:hypothetical protein